MRVRLILVMATLCLAAGLAACGDDDEGASAETAGSGTEAAGGDREAENVSGGERSYLFVQNADSGTFDPAGGGSYDLTLEGVDPHALFFAERPAEDTGVIRQTTLLDAIFDDDEDESPPNAALEYYAPDGRQGTAAVKLEQPRYDAGQGTLSYSASPLKNTTTSGLKHLDDRLDRRIPQRFGEASLFIDSAHDGNTCLLFLKTSVPGGLELESASKWSTDEWDVEPQPHTGLAPNAGFSRVAESQGEDFRGCHNSTVWGAGTGGTIEISLTDPWTGENHFPCIPSDRTKYVCTLEPRSTIHGMIIEIYYSVDPA